MMRKKTGMGDGGWGMGKTLVAPSHHQPGFALPTAVFLLVVLGGLAAWLVSLTQASLAQSDLELVGERAYQAAQAGLEAGIYAVRVNGSCAAQSLSFTGGLARFTATVACTAYTADEGGTSVKLYRIEATACNQPSGGACPNASPSGHEYVERMMRATVESS